MPSAAKDTGEAVDWAVAVPSPIDPSEDKIFEIYEHGRRNELDSSSSLCVISVGCRLIRWSPNFAWAKTLFVSCQTSSFNPFTSARSVFHLGVAHSAHAGFWVVDQWPELFESLTSVLTAISAWLDIQPDTTWAFDTHPGAWRRILMNVLGNALKYTPSGYIYVGLASYQSCASRSQMGPVNQSLGEQNQEFDVTLTVKDTGKGIGSEYLQNKSLPRSCRRIHLHPVADWGWHRPPGR